MNKKGEGIVNVIIVVFILFLLMLIGLGAVFGGMIINWVFDEAVPELTTIGVVGSSNVSQATSYALNPVNTLVQSFTWMGGVLYIMALFGCLGLAMAFKVTGSKWLMGFFIACMLMLVIASIFISNIYQDFYEDDGDVGVRLQEQTLLSFLILQSPMIICIIGFISGIIMFTGDREEATA